MISLNRDRDDVRLWTISEAARQTGLSRTAIRAAIKLYSASRGAFGLAFVQPTVGDRPRIRRQQVVEWMSRMERSAAGR